MATQIFSKTACLGLLTALDIACKAGIFLGCTLYNLNVTQNDT